MFSLVVIFSRKNSKSGQKERKVINESLFIYRSFSELNFGFYLLEAEVINSIHFFINVQMKTSVPYFRIIKKNACNQFQFELSLFARTLLLTNAHNEIKFRSQLVVRITLLKTYISSPRKARGTRNLP